MNLSLIKDFKNLWGGLKVEDSFTRNLAVTFSGQAFGQVIGFLFTPFIARIYGPENYGVFALFMAIASNFALVSTFQLPTGYVSAQNDRELHVLVRLSFFVLLFFTTASALALIFFKNDFVLFFDAENLKVLIYLIPVYIFFMGFDYILLGWNIYLKQFGRGAVAKITSIIVSKSATLAYGLLVAPTPYGLVGGNFVIYPLETVVKFSKQIKAGLTNLMTPLPWKEIRDIVNRFKSYPLFVTPGLLVTSISGQLPVYCFSIYFENLYVGLFALANSIVTVPISVVTNSTTTVFLQKAAETQKTNANQLKHLVLSLHKKLFLIAFLPLTCFAFIGDWAFTLVFGTAWEQAGWIAAFLSVSAILSVPQQPLSVLFRLLNSEHYNFLLNISSIILKLAGLGAGIFFHDIKIAVAGYALASILTTGLSLALIFRIVNVRLIELTWYVLAVLAIFTMVTLQKF